MTSQQTQHRISLLDGGMGREILRMGAPFGQPEWSARALREAPEMVRKAHEAFAEAGCDLLTTSNYAVVPFHIGADKFASEGPELIERSGALTREVADRFGCRVAGSLPPLFGSYRPDLFVADNAQELLQKTINGLRPHIDLWLAETISSLAEARAVIKALANDRTPLWISFTLQDKGGGENDTPLLRSGEDVRSAVRLVCATGCSAILFNCSQPEVMARAVRITHEEIEFEMLNRPDRLKSDPPAIGVYANAFPALPPKAEANSSLQEIRDDLDPAGYLSFVEEWVALGATIVGGCCGIGPEHIAAIREKLEG